MRITESKLVWTSVLLASNALAQAELPTPISPINGEIFIRYVAGHESICVANSSGDKTTTRVTKDSSGALKLMSEIDTNGNSLQITMGLNASGTGFSSTEPQFQSKQTLPEPVLKFLKAALINASKKSNYALGVPLWQNKSVAVAEDMCSLFPQLKPRFHSGNFKIIGATLLHGRETILFRGEETISCQLPDGQTFEIHMKGWKGVDRLSGLDSNSSISLITNGSSEEKNTNTDCEITMDNAQAIVPLGSSTTKSAERRLTELKSLLDKGLISQEQYEKKRTEILTTL